MGPCRRYRKTVAQGGEDKNVQDAPSPPVLWESGIP